MQRLILVADEPKEIAFYEEVYGRMGYKVVPLQFRNEVEALVSHEKFSMAVINFNQENVEVSGGEILARLRVACPNLSLMAVLTEESTNRPVGIDWFIRKPLTPKKLEELTARLRR